MGAATPFTKEDYIVLAAAARAWPVGQRPQIIPSNTQFPLSTLCKHRKYDKWESWLKTLEEVEAVYRTRWRRNYFDDLVQSPPNVARRFAMMAGEVITPSEKGEGRND